FERKDRRLGSKFKVKQVSAFLGLSVLQVGLLSFLAYGLINKSTERWFSVPAYVILEKAVDVTKYYYETTQANQVYFSRLIADALRGRGITPAAATAELAGILTAEQARYRIDRIAVYTPDLQPIFPRSADGDPALSPAIRPLLSEALSGRESCK